MTASEKNKKIRDTIISSFHRVHNKLGYGFLEEVYEKALLIELEKACLSCINHTPVKVYYDHRKIGDFYADIIVGEDVIIKIISAEEIKPSDEKELLNTMKATGVSTGMVLNFGMQAHHVICEMKKEMEKV